MKKKILILTSVFIAVFVAVTVLRMEYVKAQLVEAQSFLWGGSKQDSNGASSGVGWISLTSTNDTGGSVTYGIDIPSSNGSVKGFAWSSNVGWIDFNSQDHCTTGNPIAANQQYRAVSCTNPDGNANGVFRQDDKLVGWARFVEIAKETTRGNSGGWDGWIKMNADETRNYAVKIQSDGHVNGYAWSSELGTLEFKNVKSYFAPNVEISVLPWVYLETGEIFPTNKKSTSISWTIVGQDIVECTRTCKKADGTTDNCSGWTNNPSLINGNVNVTINDSVETFILSCRDSKGAVDTDTKTVTYGCRPSTCDTNQTCQKNAGSFTTTTNGNAAACMVGCTTDSDCALREGTVWREVAPN